MFKCRIYWYFFIIVFVSNSFANEKSALVIGNQNYNFLPLTTPLNDAHEMSLKLQSAGYKVTLLTDQKQSEMYDATDQFFFESGNAQVVLIYYAGHAVQINGRNLLIPVDMTMNTPDVLSRMFDIRYLLNKLTESSAANKVVILDACRNNPFSKNPNASSGLSELIAPPGTFVAFSTAPGSTAEDGDGDNSPYTTALIDTVFRSGLKIEDAFKKVRQQVRVLTDNLQTPWESTSLVQDFYLVPMDIPLPNNNATNHLVATEKKKPLGLTKNETTHIKRSLNGIASAVCSRLLTKMSLGLIPLTEPEQEKLSNCK